MATKPGMARTPEPNDDATKIVLQVGTELRITNNGEIILSNPELELSRETRAADATILYKFDSNKESTASACGRSPRRPQAYEEAQARRLAR